MGWYVIFKEGSETLTKTADGDNPVTMTTAPMSRAASIVRKRWSATALSGAALLELSRPECGTMVRTESRRM